jgi:hypothetical protein
MVFHGGLSCHVTHHKLIRDVYDERNKKEIPCSFTIKIIDKIS